MKQAPVDIGACIIPYSMKLVRLATAHQSILPALAFPPVANQVLCLEADRVVAKLVNVGVAGGAGQVTMFVKPDHGLGGLVS